MSFKKINFCLVLLILFSFSSVLAEGDSEIYRLYNGSTGEHLFTSDVHEADVLGSQGWTDEGCSWTSPNSGEPVYRLNNGGDHLYTKDTNEVDVLTSQGGWSADNNRQPLYYSGGSVPIYRLYNPATGRHHLTTDAHENEVLGTSGGWNQEGVGFSALLENEFSNIASIKNHYRNYINIIKESSREVTDNENAVPLRDIGYALVDIDRNGTKDIVIGTLGDPFHFNACAVYSIDGTTLPEDKSIGTSVWMYYGQNGNDGGTYIQKDHKGGLIGKNRILVKDSTDEYDYIELCEIYYGGSDTINPLGMSRHENGFTLTDFGNRIRKQVGIHDTYQETNIDRTEYDKYKNMNTIPITYKSINEF